MSIFKLKNRLDDSKRKEIESIKTTINLPDIKTAFLMEKSESDLGKYNYSLLNSKKKKFNENFGLIIAAPGAGKTTKLILPMIYNYAKHSVSDTLLDGTKYRRRASLVFSDPKGELYQTTKIYLEKENYKVIPINLIDPEEKGTEHYTFLQLAIDNIKKAVETNNLTYYRLAQDEIKNIGFMLIPASGSNDPFWENSARGVFGALFLSILDMFYEKYKTYYFERLKINNNIVSDNVVDLEKEIQYFEKGLTIPNIVKILNDSYKNGDFEDEDTDVGFKLFLKSSKDIIVENASVVFYVNTGKTLSSVISVFSEAMNKIVADGGLYKVLSANTINLDWIAEGYGEQKNPVAIFFITDSDKPSRHPLVTLMIDQIYQSVTSLSKKKYYGRVPMDVHYIIDEFANFPKFNNIATKVSEGRGYGNNFIFVLQSFGQLENKYKEEWKTLRDSFHVHYILGVADQDILEFYSKKTGEKYETVKGGSVGRNGQHGDEENISYNKVAGLPAYEIEKLKASGNVFLYEQGKLPKITNFVPWYEVEEIKNSFIKLKPSDKYINNKVNPYLYIENGDIYCKKTIFNVNLTITNREIEFEINEGKVDVAILNEIKKKISPGSEISNEILMKFLLVEDSFPKLDFYRVLSTSQR